MYLSAKMILGYIYNEGSMSLESSCTNVIPIPRLTFLNSYLRIFLPDIFSVLFDCPPQPHHFFYFSISFLSASFILALNKDQTPNLFFLFKPSHRSCANLILLT